MLISSSFSNQVADREEWLESVKKALVRWERGRALAQDRRKTQAHRFLCSDKKCPLCKLLVDKGQIWHDCYNCIVNYTFEITCYDLPEMRNIVSPTWVKEHTYRELLKKVEFVIEMIHEMIEVLEDKRERVSRAVY